MNEYAYILHLQVPVIFP